eukprot:scaffold83100_cov53-Phaeocystis_antarctica.AAC.2
MYASSSTTIISLEIDSMTSKSLMASRRRYDLGRRVLLVVRPSATLGLCGPACGSGSLCCSPIGGRLPKAAGLEAARMPGRMRRLAATFPRLTQGRPSTQQRFEHARCKVSSALLERLQRQPTGGAYKVFQTPL